MNRLRLGIFSCAIFAMGIGLASCGEDSYHQKEERYVFVTFNSALPYWQEAEAGFQDAGKWLGVKVEFAGPEKFAPEEELAAFQKAVSEKPSGILLSASRKEIFRDAIDGAIAQGIPVICIDSDAPNSKRSIIYWDRQFSCRDRKRQAHGRSAQGQGKRRDRFHPRTRQSG